MSFGMELGRGSSATDILASRKAVTEGAETAPALVALADKLGVDLPICTVVLEMIEGQLSARAAVDRLLNRPLKEEQV
jgi:glycerol-3-phosphate dehydrogenase (NAD(P)+)